MTELTHSKSTRILKPSASVTAIPLEDSSFKKMASYIKLLSAKDESSVVTPSTPRTCLFDLRVSAEEVKLSRDRGMGTFVEKAYTVQFWRNDQMVSQSREFALSSKGVRLELQWEKLIMFRRLAQGADVQPKSFFVKLIKRRRTELGLIHELISQAEISLNPSAKKPE